MDILEHRTELANSFMETMLAENITAKRIKAELWPSMIALTEGGDYHRPFGFSVPQYFAYDEKWAFFFCPEVIVETTAALTGDQFGEWLRYTRAHISVHVTRSTYDEEEVDSYVFSVMPESRDLLITVYDHLFV